MLGPGEKWTTAEPGAAMLGPGEIKSTAEGMVKIHEGSGEKAGASPALSKWGCFYF
jgi:hypothetical protein